MSGNDEDRQLVKRVQQGDKSAFDMLVLKYQHKVLSVIGRYVRDQSECQDVAQEAFIKAYRALPKFRGDSAFYTWLHRIAINTAKNFLVSQGRRPPASDLESDSEAVMADAALQDQSTPENELFSMELQRAVHEVLKSLPEELRAALTLREFDGLSYDEIADILHCPVGTVRSRIFRAREAIDKRIAPVYGAKVFS
ncbi:RNA polymerase RpoE-like sigma-24 subunit [Sinobacterium caligoides]|uniref:RNA polymerase RpoE-like sigma-24 subunit n=1 Tax=Sinobacterium caligoides TaxID=933926 RepID=A0A3N2DY82_9GAMM|nr:RNA polymerase sigma factor RpoE [Sinobacterium caligoides]ROS04724.1 RNA polymerase RpoE-like sigma-24 subunit [Sinobacterium caligoides]